MSSATHRRGRRTALAALLAAATATLCAVTTTGPHSTAGRAAAAEAPSWLPPTPDQWPLVVDEQQSAPTTLTRGVEHYTDNLQTTGGAQRGNILDVDLTDPNVRFGVVQADDHLTAPADEVPTSMARRTGAVAGINGDFFEINSTGRAEGIVLIGGRLVKSPRADRPWNLWVRRDGSIGMGAAGYSGTVTAGTASNPITSVNNVPDLTGNGLVRVTPDLGTPAPIPASVLAHGHRDGDALVVDAVSSGVTDLPQLSAGTEDLVGVGTSGAWLSAHARPGTRITVTENVTYSDGTADADVAQALSGGAILVKDGARAVPDQGPGENNIANPETALGVTRDGKRTVMLTFDGHQSEGIAQGLARPQLAAWLIQHGVYNAILFDSGSSTQMVGRVPGDTQASVLNVPSDGHERPVANGLFLYSARTRPGRPATAVANDGKALTLLSGTTVPAPVYALDDLGNPAQGAVSVRVVPASIAGVTGTTLHAHAPGTGTLSVTAGRARTSIPLQVVDHVAKISVTPAQADLGNGAKQMFTAAATAADGSDVLLPADAFSWSAIPAGLGAVTPAGSFTAAATGSVLGTVDASAGGATGSASVAVGQTPVGIDPLTDVSTWGVSDSYMNVYPRRVPSPGPHQSQNGNLSFAPDVSPPGSTAGSFKVHYNYAKADKTHDFDVFLNDPESEQIPVRDGQAPIGIGLWAKGNADLASRPGAVLAPGIVSLNVGYWQSTNQPTSIYPTGITFDGWQYVVAKLPAGMQFPLRMNYLALVVIKPDHDLSGDVYFGGLQALYSPRPPTTKPYVPLPDNPSWLRFTDPGSFAAGGTTVAALDDAHVVSTATAATGPAVMRSIAGDVAQLPDPARPDVVQALGDMPDSGTPDNLAYAKSLLAAIGAPYHDAPGNHEITQGANPENGNFAQAFGDTHYAYDIGDGDAAARAIVTDSSHIGITASDPFQVPALPGAGGDFRSQYLWLADQLEHNTKKVAIVATHTPAYDPHPRADSQFTDRWEAQMYEALLARYQRTHPGVHVLLLAGHARGFAEELLDPAGTATSTGLPNFVVADAGSPPYATPDEGGFYHYALFHVGADGTVQFAVQPVLASVAIAAPAPLALGGTETLTATGTSVSGTDLPAIAVPIADPVSRA
ncbi:MAG: phosphodiester glycosidase family protein [Mycobacteriales bacterium]